jgi:oligopeptide transport system substrate-binding protein
MKKPLLTTEYLGMNVTLEPFNDKKVRKAFNYAVNKQKIVDRVYNGKRTIAKGVLPPGFPGFNEKNQVPYPYDPDKALSLLAEAGWKDTDGDGLLDKNGKKFTITLWHNQREILAALGSSVQSDLAEIGIEVDVRALQWAPYIDKVRNGEAKFFRFGWAADYPDPDNFLWTLFSSDNIGQDNTTHYSNKTVDKMLEEARTTNDWSKREKLYQDAEQIVIDDAPWIFLENEVQYKIVQPYLKGMQIHPLIQNIMKNVDIDLSKKKD